MATKLVNGEPVEMTAEEEAAFEASRRPGLSAAKKAARERIRDRRKQAERSGFAHGGVRYDSEDRGTIALLANGARAGVAGFPVRVVSLDGDTETGFSRAEYQAFEASLQAHLLACSANAQALRQAVQAATDLNGVDAVNVEAGWP